MALRNYFKKHPEYPWQEDRNKTQIFIQAGNAEDVPEHNINPAVIVENGSTTQFDNTALGTNYSAMTSYKMAYTEFLSSFLVRGSVQIHCIAEAEDASEELAYEIALFMQSLKHISGLVLQLQELSAPAMSVPQRINGGTWSGNYDTVIMVSYAYSIKQKFTPIDLGPLLKDIQTMLDNDGDSGFKGGVGGTNTGGQSGNWGGTGKKGGGDSYDDNNVTLKFDVPGED